jgi:hypothetical protein
MTPSLARLTVIAALVFMALRPAHAAELPAEMLGPWCGQYSYNFPDDQEAMHWWRIDDVEGCGNRGGILVRKDGYDYARFGPQASCQFTAVEFRRHGKSTDRLNANWGQDTRTMEEERRDAPPPSDVFLIRATCKRNPAAGWTMPEQDEWTESFEIQTSNNWLRFEEKGEG